MAKTKCSIKTCTKPAAPGKKMCEEHRQIFADRAAAQRDKRKADGKCITPGCNETKGLSVGGRCKTCREKNAAGVKAAATARIESGYCRTAHADGPRPVKDGCTMCQECIDRLSATSSEHYERRKAEGTCYYCSRPPMKDHVLCEHHVEKYAEYRSQLKLDAFNAYGGPKCALCPEDDPAILEIDHIDGGGNAHRREIKVTSGTPFYQWLRNNNYPKGYRVLCPTCNKRSHTDSLKVARK